MNSCTKNVVELWTGTEHPQKPAELLTWNASLTRCPNDVFSNHQVFLYFCHSLSHKLPGIGLSGHQFIDDFLGAQSLKHIFFIRNAHKMNFCTEKIVELRTGKHQYLTYLSKVPCFAIEKHTTIFEHFSWRSRGAADLKCWNAGRSRSKGGKPWSFWPKMCLRRVCAFSENKHGAFVLKYWNAGSSRFKWRNPLSFWLNATLWTDFMEPGP